MATLRDATGQATDFQIVHHNQGAAKLLKVAVDGLQWQRLSEGSHLLCGEPALVRRLREVVARSDARDQFEIDSRRPQPEAGGHRLRRHPVADHFRRHAL